MAPPLTTTVPGTFLLILGVGNLSLALFLGVLFAFRRRPGLLYWTLTWLSGGLWLLLGTPDLPAPLAAEAAAEDSWWRYLGQLCGWWHAALWVLSILTWRSHESPLAPQARRSGSGPGFRTRMHVLVLLAATAVALAAHLAGPTLAGALLQLVLAAAYLGNVAELNRIRATAGRGIVAVLSVALVVAAVARLLTVALLLGWVPEGIVPGPNALASGQFACGVLLALAVLLFLVEGEQLERRQTVQRLEDSEGRFRLIFEHSGVGMALLTPLGRIIEVNPALVRMLGYAAEELHDRRLADLVYQMDATSEKLQEGKVSPGYLPLLYEREKRYVHKDHHSIWARVLRVPVRGGDGQVQYYVGVLVDITETKKAEQALAASEQRYRLLYQAAGEGIHVTGERAEFLDVNPAFCQLLGYRREELLNKRLTEVAEDVEAIRRHRETILRRGGDRLETRLRGREGTIVEVELTGALLELEGRLLFHEICRDVGERKRAEEAVRQSRKMQTLAALVGGIAHDFNNQLTAILGNLGLVTADLETWNAETGVPRVEDLLAPLRDAEKAGQRCAAFTQRLLTFSRGRVGSTRVIGVDELLTETVSTLRREMPETVALRVEKGEGLWPVLIDPLQLQQVLLNLAANARDAMPSGGILSLKAVNRELSAADSAAHPEGRPGRFVEISVRDTGSGMTPEVLARLFEPFFTTKKGGQASGMGLAMAYGIVKAHGGWITVQSTADLGSTFRVLLPTAEVGPAAAAPPAAAASGASHGCVLLVDDEELIRGFARTCLERKGFRVLTAADGEEALRVYRQRAAEIDVVLLDYMMPRLTGPQVFEQLKRLDPRVRVVFSSGYTMDRDSGELLALGARAFVPKPYRPEELIRAVRKVMDEKTTG